MIAETFFSAEIKRSIRTQNIRDHEKEHAAALRAPPPATVSHRR
jgi:hypothetical protein